MFKPNKEVRGNQLIRKLKIHRVSLWSILLGVVLLSCANVDIIKYQVIVEWIKMLAGTLIVAGIVTGTYELMVREETLKQITESIDETFRVLKKDIGNTVKQSVSSCVGQSLLLDKKIQKEILSSGKISEVMLTCLSTKVGEEMSQELLTGVINPVINAFESTKQRVMYDYDLNIQLEESKEPGTESIFYSLRLRVEYKYVLKIPQFRFACATSLETFRVLIDDPTVVYAYYLSNPTIPDIRFNIDDIDLQCEGHSISLQRTESKIREGVKEISYGSFELPKYVGKECKLFYRISTLIRKDGHMYFVRIKHPIRNLRATFDSGNTTITQVSVSDQFVASGGVVLQEETIGGRIRRVVSVDGWVFPNSGVTFVWH